MKFKNEGELKMNNAKKNKINEIKRKIEEGTYKIDSLSIANAMLNNESIVKMLKEQSKDKLTYA